LSGLKLKIFRLLFLYATQALSLAGSGRVEKTGKDKQMEKIFKVINEMHQKGILKDYAIGGAVATIYYTEPFATKDIDIL